MGCETVFAKVVENDMGNRNEPQPSIAVLMATYNGATYIGEQIATIASQQTGRISLYASDDGSTDETLSILKQFGESGRFAGFVRLDGPQRGFAENFRSLILAVPPEFDFVAFSDQDDVWPTDKFTRAVEALSRFGPDTPAVYCGRTAIIDKVGRRTGRSPLFARPPAFRNALVQSIAGGNTMVLNRRGFEIVREASARAGFISHDWWAYLVISGVGGEVVYSASETIGYRDIGTNLVGPNTSFAAKFRRALMVLKGRFYAFNESNIASLAKIEFLLTDDAREAYRHFQAAHRGRFPQRLFALFRSGVYRQTWIGNVSLVLGCAIGKI